jgi:hypothetical protein
VLLVVNVLRHVSNRGVVGELNCSLIVFIDCCGTVLLLMDIFHQLPEFHCALPGAAGRYVFRSCDGKSHYFMLLESPTDSSTIEHYHLSRL